MTVESCFCLLDYHSPGLAAGCIKPGSQLSWAVYYEIMATPACGSGGKKCEVCLCRYKSGWDQSLLLCYSARKIHVYCGLCNTDFWQHEEALNFAVACESALHNYVTISIHSTSRTWGDPTSFQFRLIFTLSVSYRWHILWYRHCSFDSLKQDTTTVCLVYYTVV